MEVGKTAQQQKKGGKKTEEEKSAECLNRESSGNKNNNNKKPKQNSISPLLSEILSNLFSMKRKQFFYFLCFHIIRKAWLFNTITLRE